MDDQLKKNLVGAAYKLDLVADELVADLTNLKLKYNLSDLEGVVVFSIELKNNLKRCNNVELTKSVVEELAK